MQDSDRSSPNPGSIVFGTETICICLGWPFSLQPISLRLLASSTMNHLSTEVNYFSANSGFNLYACCFYGSYGGQFMHMVAKFTLWLFVDRVEPVGATAQQQPGRPHKLKSHDNEKQMFPQGIEWFCCCC